MTNVADGDPAVKRSPVGAGPSAAPAPGREALEISRLLVEVLQVGRVGRRGTSAAADVEGAFAARTASGAGASGGHGGPIASHAIRAAIHIYGHGPQTIGQLATGLGVSQGWASRVVDEMERAGYVERERDPADRRVVRVRLVPAAVERVELAYRWRGDEVEAALEGMSRKERAAVAEFLRRFVDAVRASDGG